ncbi:fumarylacetoacetate hydrolase family protein [Rhodococcus sp. MSC1_016]|jgi:2-keto-4-pentenoate hydratase/2-oxohepta-3-ene-1,7-dioic acid hydratase in catechol pathway|uniref:fumarylacetoacetate hydrolase family protein n=1 Tax=Rhodococcus sp. MSC1_016 TaxID=2909266 RepID=UPI00202E775E|nr:MULTISPECIES: fumarylacetoacetate hydrolase family protein [Rhodococcus]
MRLYVTDQGIAREDRTGVLSLLDLPYRDLGELLEGPGLEATRDAQVLRELQLDEVALRAPVHRPGKVVIVGLNYPSHAEEALEAFAAIGRADIETPTEPNLQLTAGSAVADPDSTILLPSVAATEVDYEGELAVVIGQRATHVSSDDAWKYVAGLTVANDVSARDIQRRAMTGDTAASIGVSKSFDTFKPLGPCLVTADEFPDDVDLAIQTRVNGEIRQDDRTSSFIHSIPTLVAHLSKYQTLEPGDVICTGTPRGAGVFSGTFLQEGDVVEVEIERIGVLRSHVGVA